MSFLSIAAYVVSGLTIVIVNKSWGAMGGGGGHGRCRKKVCKITSFFSIQEQVYICFLKKQNIKIRECSSPYCSVAFCCGLNEQSSAFIWLLAGRIWRISGNSLDSPMFSDMSCMVWFSCHLHVPESPQKRVQDFF